MECAKLWPFLHRWCVYVIEILLYTPAVLESDSCVSNGWLANLKQLKYLDQRYRTDTAAQSPCLAFGYLVLAHAGLGEVADLQQRMRLSGLASSMPNTGPYNRHRKSLRSLNVYWVYFVVCAVDFRSSSCQLRARAATA